MHSITTRQGVRERGTVQWARMVADYGVALPGRQGWRCIKWPEAQHGSVEGVQADELMEGVEDIRADELRGGGPAREGREWDKEIEGFEVEG